MDQNDFYKTVLDNLSDGVYFVDTNRVIKYWNKGAERITGFKASEVVGRSCSDNVLVHVNKKGTYLCKKMCPLAATIKDGKARSSQIFLRHKDGHRQPVYVSVIPIRDDKGNITGGAECFYDNSQTIAALKEVEELKRDSLLCKLTGVGNREYIEQFIETKLKELEWRQTKIAVMGFEIDKYDQYKQKLGQKLLDIIVKMVANTLSNNLQSYDFIGRWSNREFIAILTKPNLMNYVFDAELLCILVSRSSQALTKNKLHVTVSGGVCLASSTDTKEAVFDRLNALIKKSKDSGGNRVTA